MRMPNNPTPCSLLALLLLLFSLSSPHSQSYADSIFDGYIPCADKNECANTPGDHHGETPGPIDFRGVRNYGRSDAPELVNMDENASSKNATDKTSRLKEEPKP